MENFLKRFFSLICPLFEKRNVINLNFHDQLLFKQFFSIKIQPNMSEQEKKRQRVYDLLNAETKPKFLCLPYTKQRKLFNRKRAF